jgi:hypothetical protein
MSVTKICVCVAITTVLLGANISVSNADMFGNVSGGGTLLGGGSSSGGGATVSPEQLNGGFSDLEVRFAAAMQNMLRAQSITAGALGDKTRSEQLAAEAKDLEGKADFNTVARKIEISTNAAKANEAKMADSSKLSASAKAKLATAVIPYGTGTVQGAKLPSDYAAWLQQAQASVNSMKSNPTQALSGGHLVDEVSEVTKVTPKLPGLIEAWASSTRAFVNFAQTNHVKVGDLASKI